MCKGLHRHPDSILLSESMTPKTEFALVACTQGATGKFVWRGREFSTERKDGRDLKREFDEREAREREAWKRRVIDEADRREADRQREEEARNRKERNK